MWPVIILIIIIALAYAFQPSISTPEPTKETFEATTAKETDPVPVIFGTMDIAASNVVWYGDGKTTAIRKKGGKK